jgi:hypothetical protein
MPLSFSDHVRISPPQPKLAAIRNLFVWRNAITPSLSAACTDIRATSRSRGIKALLRCVNPCNQTLVYTLARHKLCEHFGLAVFGFYLSEKQTTRALPILTSTYHFRRLRSSQLRSWPAPKALKFRCLLDHQRCPGSSDNANFSWHIGCSRRR